MRIADLLRVESGGVEIVHKSFEYFVKIRYTIEKYNDKESLLNCIFLTVLKLDNEAGILSRQVVFFFLKIFFEVIIC